MPAVNYESQYQFQQQQQMQTGDDDTNNTGGGDDGPLNFGREEIDQTYIVLKQASEMAISSSNVSNRRIQQQQQQQTLSSSLDQPPQQNISASDQSLVSSTGAINRTSNVMRITTSSTQLQQQQQPTGSSMSSSSRRANPNSLSVGDPSSSFLSSSSGKYVHSCENALIFSQPSLELIRFVRSRKHKTQITERCVCVARIFLLL